MIDAIKAQKKNLRSPKVAAAMEERIVNYQRQVRGDLRSKNTIEFQPEDELLYRVQQNFVEIYCELSGTEI